jgi:hypothetical protein
MAGGRGGSPGSPGPTVQLLARALRFPYTVQRSRALGICPGGIVLVRWLLRVFSSHDKAALRAKECDAGWQYVPR